MAGTERSENNGWEIEKDGWNQRHLKKMARKDRSEKDGWIREIRKDGWKRERSETDGWNREIRKRWLEQRDKKIMAGRSKKMAGTRDI